MDLCDFYPIFELQSLSKTVSTASQVSKLQSQFLHSNIADGILLQAIHGGHVWLELVELIGICGVIFLLQLVSFIVDGDPL